MDTSELFLLKPSDRYAEEIRAYRREFLENDSSMDGCGSLRHCEDPLAYLAECEKYTVPETVPEGRVVATQFFCIRKSDNRLVGMIQVRHTLNEYLASYAGHIGYSVRPGERRKGYATAMLKAVLPYCKEIGLTKVLITCIDGNIGSEKVIRHNGGVYESTVYEAEKNCSLKRFWITL